MPFPHRLLDVTSALIVWIRCFVDSFQRCCVLFAALMMLGVFMEWRFHVVMCSSLPRIKGNPERLEVLRIMLLRRGGKRRGSSNCGER